MRDNRKTRRNRGKDCKYTIKDSVFLNLFKMKKISITVIPGTHPEDTTATEDELTDITLRMF